MNVGDLFVSLGVVPGDLKGIDEVASRIKETIRNTVSPALGAGAAAAEGGANGDPKKVAPEVEKTTSAKKKAREETERYDKSVKGLSTSLSSIVNPLNVMRAKLLLVFSAMTYASNQASQYAASLTRFQLVTGLSVRGLQELQQAFALSGVSGEETMGAIESIQRASAEIKLGSGNLAPWAILGIDPKSDPFTVLGQIQKRMNAIPTEYSTLALRQLGMSDMVIAAMKEMASLPPPNPEFLLSEGQIKRLKEFNVYWNRTMDEAKRGMQKLGYAVLPVVEWIVYGVHRIARVFVQVGKYFEDNEAKIKNWGAVIGIALLALAVKFFPVTAGILLATVALEDFFTYMRGGESTIGDMIEYFRDWENVLTDVGAWLDTIVSVLAEVIDNVGMLTGLWNSDFLGSFMDSVDKRGTDPGAAMGARLSAGAAFASSGMGGGPAKTEIKSPITVNQNNSFTIASGNLFEDMSKSKTPLYDSMMGITHDAISAALEQSPIRGR